MLQNEQRGYNLQTDKNYEQQYIIDLAHGLAASAGPRSMVAVQLFRWASENDLGLDLNPEIDYFVRNRIPPKEWKKLQEKLAKRANRKRKPKPDTLSCNIAELAEHLGLDEDETRIFDLAVRAKQSGQLGDLCRGLIRKGGVPVREVVSMMTGIPWERVSQALTPNPRMVSSGMIRFGRQCDMSNDLGVQPLDRLVSALVPPSNGLADVMRKLFSPVAPTTLGWDDFGHLGPARDFALDLLSGAVSKKKQGVHILLHGKPGTGKTEFCKVLAKQAGATLHAVGEEDEDGDEPSRQERMQELKLGQNLLADQGDSVILFDEMEDVLPGASGGRRKFSKVHMNRTLENNAVPVLWTANDISDCDPAFLRRILFTFEMRTPPAVVRAGIWRKHADERGIDLPEGFCMEMAEAMPNAPAIAASALRAASIADGGAEEVRLAADALSRAVCGQQLPSAAGACRFDPALANADQDLAVIADRLAAHGAANAGGLCLSGPPGTGKSAFARYIADRLQMQILEKRASDLLGRYVGESEKNIAAAFAEARDTEAFLIFDEADSLLRSREGADRRWEVSQVNEMLTWMESHPLPFACTTNHIDQLDAATMRRFGLRVKFLPLSDGQRDACFRRFFSADAPPGLRRLDLLTPGDFAAVAKRTKMLGFDEPDAILAELAKEQDDKPGAGSPIGFQAA